MALRRKRDAASGDHKAERPGARLPQTEPQAAEHDESERETRNLRQDRHRARPRPYPLARRHHEVDADANRLKRPEFEPERHDGKAQHGHRHDDNADERGREQIGDEPVMRHAMEMIEREGRDRGAGDERRGGGVAVSARRPDARFPRADLHREAASGRALRTIRRRRRARRRRRTTSERRRPGRCSS
jgi:hypothetical protein